MGSYSSTRWRWHNKKQTVEESRVLSIFDFKREGLLQPNRFQTGLWWWRNSYTGKKTASINYLINTMSPRPWLRLLYHINAWNGEERKFDYQVELQTTHCHFGGLRWWFICPLLSNGRPCGRRVAKLYMPPGGFYFGCRHCHDLTYRSSQESDKRVNALKQLGVLNILNGINSGEIELLLGLKALPDNLLGR